MIRSHQEERLIDQLNCHVENGQRELACLTTGDGGESLNELFGNCMPRLFRVADCVLHNCQDSEDALQDGLLSALRHISQFKGNSQFSTWLFSIVRNSALAKLRKHRAHPIVSMDDQARKTTASLVRRKFRRSRTGPGTGVRAGGAVLPVRPDSRRFAPKLPRDHSAVRLRGLLRKGSRPASGADRLSLEGATSSARLAVRESMGPCFRKEGRLAPCFLQVSRTRRMAMKRP